MNEIKVKFSSDGKVDKFSNIEKAEINMLTEVLVIKHKDGARSIIDVKKADFVLIGSGVEVR